ncbi:hypothetical protein ACH427_03180 [Streptomyces sp. NPDC020379]|uniref:hypothetical protein n=1 Tax=Streptomyces sp. NPDC020379 TaxID=3365071 RepID=UPI00379E2958
MIGCGRSYGATASTTRAPSFAGTSTSWSTISHTCPGVRRGRGDTGALAGCPFTTAIFADPFVRSTRTTTVSRRGFSVGFDSMFTVSVESRR